MADADVRAPIPRALPPRVRTTLDRIDARITATLARLAVPFLRASLGIVFLWFGALKLVPGLSPAEDRLIGGAMVVGATVRGGGLTPSSRGVT